MHGDRDGPLSFPGQCAHGHRLAAPLRQGDGQRDPCDPDAKRHDAGGRRQRPDARRRGVPGSRSARRQRQLDRRARAGAGDCRIGSDPRRARKTQGEVQVHIRRAP
ncbi:hypothetical protein LP420_07515 [Massilia sp. B-10]|nr:hypothetical protein LP420_07515 [Massilia sp. B-10]